MSYETDISIVKADILRGNLVANVDVEVNEVIFEETVKDDDNKFLRLATVVEERKRASMNRLRTNFINYKQAQGYLVNVIETNKELSKSGLIKQVVPEIAKLKNKYELAYDMPDNKGYTNICAVIQKWIDQSLSANHYYQYSIEGISLSGVIKDILHAYKYGMKTLYYANTDDKKSDNIETMGASDTMEVGCEGGACAI
jgi:ribonucleotide reductase alpha subunit